MFQATIGRRHHIPAKCLIASSSSNSCLARGGVIGAAEWIGQLAKASYSTAEAPPQERRVELDDDKDKQTSEEIDPKSDDVMAHSFGKAYATRSEEEGFGGIYGGNNSNTSDEDDGDNVDRINTSRK